MRKLTFAFYVSFSVLTFPLFAQSDADRIKSLEEKVEMLTNQLGLDKVDSTEEPSTPKLTLKEKYDQKLEKIKAKIPFEINGSVDVFVQTNFNGKQTNAVLNRAFVNKANSFELGMINLKMSKKIKKVGFCADLGFGPRAETANNTLYSNTILAIRQLYVSYAPANWVEFTLGNFSTIYAANQAIELRVTFKNPSAIAKSIKGIQIINWL